MEPAGVWECINDQQVHNKVNSRKSDRFIICHLRSSATGLLEGFLLVLRERKSKKTQIIIRK